jgi:hypothetical protein
MHFNVRAWPGDDEMWYGTASVVYGSSRSQG